MHASTLPLMFSNLLDAVVFWAAFYAWALPEWIGSARQRAHVSGAIRQDRGSYAVVIAAICVGLVLAFAAAFALPAATITLIAWQRTAVFAAGVALLLLGVALRWWAIRTLGRFFTRDVATHGDQVVVQHGPYRSVRHPAYSGTLLTMLGIGVALTNWVSLVVIVACALAGHLYRVRVEEAALQQALGQPYVDYTRRTRRFIPFIL